MIPAGLPGKESFIALISFPDGKPERYFRFPPANVLLPRLRWMPDGKGIAFITFKDRAYNIREWSFASNAVRPLTDFSSGAVWNFEFTRGGDAILLSRGETYADVVIIKNFQ